MLSILMPLKVFAFSMMQFCSMIKRGVEGCWSRNKSSVKGENEKHDLNCIEAKFIKVFTECMIPFSICLCNYTVDVFIKKFHPVRENSRQYLIANSLWIESICKVFYVQ